MNFLTAASVSATAKSTRAGDNIRVRVDLRNTGSTVSLANKLTLLNAADSARILPAYFTDNYVSLLPGESREIEIEYPAKSANGPAQLALRGWNLAKQVIPIP